MFDHLLIGLSGITVANESTYVIGQNITKSDMPQYHRKTARLSTLPNDNGVIYSYTHRETEDILQKLYYNNLSDFSFYDELYNYYSLLESYLTIGDYVAKFNDIYNVLSQLTGSRYRINDLISNMHDLVMSIRSTSDALDTLKINIEHQITSYVEQINNYLTNLTRLDHNLLDNRDQILEHLSNIMNTNLVQTNKGINILSDNGLPLILDNTVYQLKIQYNNNNNINLVNDIGTIDVDSGRLGSLIYMYNQYIPKIKNEINYLVSDFIRNINQIQATGLGIAGEYESVDSRIAVPDVFAPLATQDLPLEIFEGDITISITDINSSTRNNYTFHINPNIHSLYDISNFLSSLPGISASVNTSTGLISISALPGYKFDFAGRDTIPATNTPVANPDTSGLLSALGINGIFDGYNADTINLRQQFIDNPNLFAFSKTGEIGNNDNIIRLLDVFKSSLFTQNNFIQSMSKIITDIGNFGTTVTNSKNYSKEIYNDTYTKLNEIIGVDTNEEFINLLKFQKMLEASSKYISIVNQTIDTLLNMF